MCPPLGKGFPTATSTTTSQPQFHRQGGKASSDEPCPTKLSRWRGSEWRRPFVYLQLKRLLKLFPTFLFPWWFTILPLNLSSPAADRRLAQLCSRVFRVRLETMFNHTVSADFSTLRFFAILPIVVIELTEYNCQSVRVPGSRQPKPVAHNKHAFLSGALTPQRCCARVQTRSTGGGG